VLNPQHGPPEATGAGLWHVSVQALEDATLHFPDGKVNFLRGPVGSGKSTALRVLAGIIVPVSGAAYAGGSWGPPGPDGYMPQQPTLLDRTVLENIALGRDPTPSLRAEIWALAERLGLAPILRRLPDGLDSQAGKNGSRLSGGQRQIVWLTRVAARAAGLLGPRPSYILLDEPTAAMDEATAKIAMQAVRTLVDEGAVRAAVVITHHGSSNE
jgi:ABC-type multidrug transport system fused ATPase/permease subunit